MKKLRQLRQLVILATFVYIFFITTQAYGSGFAIYTQGASPLGQAAATIAHNDDPSAVFYNPALINKLNGTQIQAGSTMILINREFESDATGKTFKTKNGAFFPSTFYITHKFNDKLSAGLGVFTPFGLGTDWGNDWEGRFITTSAEITTFDINPVVSYRIMPNVAVAAGIDFVILDTTLKKQLNLPRLLLDANEGSQKFKGDSTGVGYNLGLLVDLTKDVSLGASYRSQVQVDIDGKATFGLPNPALSAIFPDTKGDAHLKLPDRFHAGISYKGFDPLTLEVAYRWEGWSSFKELKVNLDQQVLGSSVAITPKRWKDTSAVIVGAKYQLNESMALLAGYLYSKNPVPDETFEPSLPDADWQLFSIGTGIRRKQLKVDLAYSFMKLESRDKRSNEIDAGLLLTGEDRANGTYNTNVHMVAASLTYAF